MDVLGANPLATAASPYHAVGVSLVRAAFLDPRVRKMYGDWEWVTESTVADRRALVGAPPITANRSGGWQASSGRRAALAPGERRDVRGRRGSPAVVGQRASAAVISADAAARAGIAISGFWSILAASPPPS